MFLKQTLVVLILFHLVFSTLAQSKTAELNGDCFNAAEIIPEGNFTFKKSPKGYGEKLEFKNNPSNSHYYFLKENNTAWFTFIAKESGILVFKIQPEKIAADFDFLLFEYTDEQFCDKIRNIKPIRSNISRNNLDSNSITGLSNNATQNFVKSGIGNPWSKKVSLKKGQRYYLVINNANDIETPFSILFKKKYESNDSTTISGVFKDNETGEIIKNVQVTIENKSGYIISESTSDSITGKYKLTVPFSKDGNFKNYILSGTKDTYFFTEKPIIISPKETYVNINLAIIKLKKGKNLTLHNINFVGNEAATLPSSEKSLNRLLNLMNKNKSLIIKIEGHTNGCSKGQVHAQKLSENRAETVRTFLISKGINKDRITTIGYGCSKMLFSIDSSEENQSQNRRVEIFVLEY